MPGTLYVVATPIGNLEDITLRALRVLREVAVIAAEDTRRTAHLLARHAIATPTTSLHAHNEVRKSEALVARLIAGESVALVTDAGTPGIADPGAHLVRSARAAGVRVEPVPGPSAVTAALSAAGLSTNQFAFLGFPPTRAKDRTEWLRRLATLPMPIVFFEAPHRIRETLQDVARAVSPERRAIVGRELTKVHEELVESPISDVAGRFDKPAGEFVVVLNIGHSTENIPSVTPEPVEIAAELGQLMKVDGLTRRQAAAKLARRFGLSPNAVYAAVESVKNSGI